MKQLFTAAVVILLAACGQRLKVEPVTVQPIHVTVDVNLNDPAALPSTPAERK